MALHFNYRADHYRKLRRRIRIISLAMLVLVLAIAAILLITNYVYRHRGNNSPAQESANTKTIDYQPFTTFTTAYFSFQTDKSWQAVPAESTSTIFVYRSSRNNLVERDLTVYVNTLPINLMLTYVLPAQAKGNQLASSNISEHCRNYVPPSYLASSRNPVSVTFETVRFTCQTDSTGVAIGTGSRGGSYQLVMPRKNGTAAQYFLLYNDRAFTHKPDIFKAIADSFHSL
jgi:hypothetical protein